MRASTLACSLYALVGAGCGADPRPSSLPVNNPDVVLAPSDLPSSRDVVSALDAATPSDLGRDDASAPPRDAPFDLGVNRPYPMGPYAGAVGAAPPPFTLPDCSGAPYAFSGPAFQQSRATVLALFTGSCATCEADAVSLQGIHSEAASRGVRVVSVLLEGAAPMEQPGGDFCVSWRTRAGATHPVLIDISRMLDVLNPAPRAFPLVLVADASGFIRGRFAMQAGWPAAVRALLATMAP
ncbi:MAG: hypothetical protein R3A48_21005 [Polyangiales bacterium]